MIKIKENLNKFITIFKIISNLSPETNITFKEDGIYVRAIHPSNTYLITLTINKSMFDTYEIDSEMTYLVDIEKFVTIMNIVGDKEMCLDFTEKGLVIKQGRKRFVLSYFNAEDDNKPRPDIKAKSKWKVNTDSFFGVVGDLINFSEVCTLNAGEELKMLSKSNLVDGEVLIEAEKIESEDSITSYDIGSINKITDIRQILPEIRIGFSTNETLLMRGTNDDIDFEFMLAGRVEDD